MKSKIKSVLLVISCLCFFQAFTFAQTTTSVDEEISNLTKRLIAAKEKRIRELEESAKKELEKEKQELERLIKESTNNQVVETTPNPTTQRQNNGPSENQSSQPVPVNITASGNSQDAQTDGRCAKFDTEPEKLSLFDRNVCAIAKFAVANRNKVRLNSSQNSLSVLFATRLKTTLFPKTTAEAVEEEKESLFFDSEKKRTDKQIGASPSSSGTTSLVVKGGTAAILGWAVENGSINSLTNGNTVTLRLNPYNLSQALFYNQSIVEIRKSEENSNPALDTFLNKLSFGFSFDTTRGRETPELSISKQQLSSWSARYEFINRRNPLSKYWNTDRQNLFVSLRDEEQTIINIGNELNQLNTYADVRQKFVNELDRQFAAVDSTLSKSAQTEAIAEIIANTTETFSVADLAVNQKVVNLFRNFVITSESYLTERKKFLDKVNRGAVATFEYTNNREVNAPDTSNFRFIYENGLRNIDLTLNAEMTVFNKKPTGMDIKRIKDFNVALQLDAPLNTKTLLNKSVLSFAFRYTRQQGDVVLPNGVVADGTKGDILFGQAKLTIPFGNTGIKLPFSLTFGNRSEFIKEKFARANFGLTFDLDQIFRPLNLLK